jgi:predicted outer membrane repeat protein
MYFSNSSPVLDHCTFRNNLGTESGGGIFYEKSPGRKMTLTDCTFSGNLGTMGGGLYVKNAAVELTSCTFTGNQASPYGGGVLLWYAEPSRFERCTFSGNTANFSGGAIRCQFTPFTSINCVFSGNASQYGSGGAISIIQDLSGSAPQVMNCTMINNTARDGGAIMTFVTSTSSAPLIQNTIFTGNTGKAIYEYDSSSDPIVRNCLFFNNPDGDYLDEGTLDTGNEGGVVKTGAAAIDALFGAGGVQNRGNVSGDPKLTGLYHLGAGSLAIDQGDATGAPATDIEIGRRPVDIAGVGIDGAGAIDIGASEFDAILPPVFITQPFAQAVDLHASATLAVAVTGTEPITYQWFRGGVALPDATSSTLKLTDATQADEGDYVCRVVNTGGWAGSRTVRVEVLTPGTLVASPLALNFPKDTRWAVDVEKGGAPTTQTLTLANAGEKPLTFTAGGPATPGLALAGADAADFQIVTVTPDDGLPAAARRADRDGQVRPASGEADPGAECATAGDDGQSGHAGADHPAAGRRRAGGAVGFQGGVIGRDGRRCHKRSPHPVWDAGCNRLPLRASQGLGVHNEASWMRLNLKFEISNLKFPSEPQRTENRKYVIRSIRPNNMPGSPGP